MPNIEIDAFKLEISELEVKIKTFQVERNKAINQLVGFLTLKLDDVVTQLAELETDKENIEEEIQDYLNMRDVSIFDNVMVEIDDSCIDDFD